MRRELAARDKWGQTLHVASLQETITGDVRPALLILLGAVGLILMLAAVNLGTLVLGRSIDRVNEMARAHRARRVAPALIRQVIIEQAVLAALGIAAGVAVASVAFPALIARIPPEVPSVGHIALDWTVLGERADRVDRRCRGRGAYSRGGHGAPEPAVAAAPIAHHGYAVTPARARRAGRGADCARRGAGRRLDADAALVVEPAACRSRVLAGQPSHLPFADDIEVSRADDRPRRTSNRSARASRPFPASSMSGSPATCP